MEHHVDNPVEVSSGDTARLQEGKNAKHNFPFDMDNLFNMKYSFDQLKMAIEYLAKQQSDQQELLQELLARPDKNFDVLSQGSK